MIKDLLPASGNPLISMAPSALKKRRMGGTGWTGSGKGNILGKRGCASQGGIEREERSPGWCLWPSGRPNFPPGVYFALCLSLMVLSLLETIFISYLLHLATSQPPSGHASLAPFPASTLHQPKDMLLRCAPERKHRPWLPAWWGKSALPTLPPLSPLLFCSCLLPHNPPADLGGPQLSLCLAVGVKEPMEFVGKMPGPRERAKWVPSVSKDLEGKQDSEAALGQPVGAVKPHDRHPALLSLPALHGHPITTVIILWNTKAWHPYPLLPTKHSMKFLMVLGPARHRPLPSLNHLPATTTMHMHMFSHFSCIQLFATPWTVAHKAPPSMGFSRQEYWSGLPFSSSRRSSWYQDRTQVSSISCIASRFFTVGAVREAQWPPDPLWIPKTTQPYQAGLKKEKVTLQTKRISMIC